MNQFKLMSFNIGGKDKKWKDRKIPCVHLLNKYSPDIVGFQEVQKENILTITSALTKYDCTYGLKNVNKKENEACYNPIYWRKDSFKRLESGAFYLSKTPNKWSKNWDAKNVRSTTWVRLQNKSGNTFIYLNLHLDHRGKQSRIESSRLIKNKLFYLQKKFNDPVVISGDFNERAWQPKDEIVNNYPFPVLPNYVPLGNHVYDEFKKFGYKDSYIESGGINQLNMNTYHDYYGLKFPNIALRIDWILTFDSKSIIKTKKFKIIYDKYLKTYPSDHFPILANIKLS